MVMIVLVIVAFMAGSFNRGRFGIVFESVYGTQRFAFQAMHAFELPRRSADPAVQAVSSAWLGKIASLMVRGNDGRVKRG